MHFCPVCNNLLMPEQLQHTQLACPACAYTYKLGSAISYTQTRSIKKIDKVFGGDEEFKFASKCSTKCPKCSHMEALFMELQTRSADEPMTIFYKCTKCRHDWKE